jgi:hypothetical protein
MLAIHVPLTREQRLRFGLSPEAPLPYEPIADDLLKLLIKEIDRTAVRIVGLVSSILCASVLLLCLLAPQAAAVVMLRLSALLIMMCAGSVVWRLRERKQRRKAQVFMIKR